MGYVIKLLLLRFIYYQTLTRVRTTSNQYSELRSSLIHNFHCDRYVKWPNAAELSRNVIRDLQSRLSI